jgi:hypothetical protein
MNNKEADFWTKEFCSLLFTVNSTAVPLDLYFFKLTQPLKVFTVHLLFPVMEKGGKPDRKPYPHPYGVRNPYRNLKSQTSQVLPRNFNENVRS